MKGVRRGSWWVDSKNGKTIKGVMKAEGVTRK